MSAKNNDDRRVQELYAVIQEAKLRVSHFQMTRESFLSDDGPAGRAFADALLMCVFRATEEAGSISDDVRRQWPDIDWRGISGMRNILAHDYGKVDRALVWSSVEDEFPVLEEFCKDYAEDHGIELAAEEESETFE